MRIYLHIAGRLVLFATVPVALSATVTLDSLLKEMTNFSSVASWPQPEFTCRQCSSYDRAEVAPNKPGWFANSDFSQYIRDEERDGHNEHVMMDSDGPGCIVRFWLTTIKNKQGTLRIYLDGNPRATLIFPAYDLLSGDLRLSGPLDQPHPGYSPTDNGGNTLMLPIPYSKHCKVTWEEAGEGPRYYQIDYRTYASGTKVRTFTHDALEAARPLIAQVDENLLAPTETMSGESSLLTETVSPRKSASLDLPAGPAAVRRLEFHVVTKEAAGLEQVLRSTILQVQFDNEDTIWCPVSDFFGSGVGVNPLQSWYRTVEADGKMSCRWVMPYAKTARITIANLGTQPVQIVLRARTSSWHWDNRSMHFHCNWHFETGLSTPPAQDWNCLRSIGQGVYVGDTLALFNPVATWYGEGDEKIRVDDESFPSFLGTGTEDYYDFSFAPRGLMQTPFANQVRVDQSMTQGNNVLTRTRNLDGIPFKKSLNFDFELISWQSTKLVYAMSTYWYAYPGASSNIRPQPDAAASPLTTLSKP
jgi:hypothetical protein